MSIAKILVMIDAAAAHKSLKVEAALQLLCQVADFCQGTRV